MSDSDHTRELMVDGAKASPVAAVVAAWLGGVSLQQWLLVLSIVYTLFLIGEKLWKFYKWIEAKRTR